MKNYEKVIDKNNMMQNSLALELLIENGRNDFLNDKSYEEIVESFNSAIDIMTPEYKNEILQIARKMAELDCMDLRQFIHDKYDAEKDLGTKDIGKILEELRTFLKADEEFENLNINYILIDPNDDYDSFAIASDYNNIIKINLLTEEISHISEWDYDIDEYVFAELEQGKEIAYMTLDSHYGIWQIVENIYPEEMEHFTGFQKYLEYCKENNITKDKIENEVATYEVFDIMQYYAEAKQRVNQEIRLLDNGMFVMDAGYRQEIPVALIERNFGSGRELIIAFNYKINDNKIEWGYGYYYGEDIAKAQNDFKKVLAGGHLVDTFNKHKNDRER